MIDLTYENIAHMFYGASIATSVWLVVIFIAAKVTSK